MIGPSCQPVPTPPAPAGWTHRELADLDDGELLGIAGSLPRFSQRRIAACELLVGRYRYLVWSCVQRYNRGPEPAEDLTQVGYVGLVAAINNFDPAVGCSLATYARSYINGEIKRYFRDKRWQLHVVRPVKELVMQARAATWQLAQELGRTPTESDLAAFLGVSDHELRDAQLAEMTFQPTSLDAGPDQPAVAADQQLARRYPALAEARQRTGYAKQLTVVQLGKLLTRPAWRSGRYRYRLVGNTYHGARPG